MVEGLGTRWGHAGMHCGCPHSIHHEGVVLLFFRTMKLVLFGGIEGGVVGVQDVKVGLFLGSVGRGVDDGPYETRTGCVVGTMSAKKVEGGLEGVQGGELERRGVSGRGERRDGSTSLFERRV